MEYSCIHNHQSQFLEMFDFDNNSHNWPVLSFKQFALLDCDMTNNFEAYADKPHIGIDSIEQNTGELLNFRTVSEDNVKSGKYKFTDKHIIYSKIRPNLNKVAMPDFDGLCSADAYPIMPNQEITSRPFLTYLLRSIVFLDYIIPLSNRTGMPKANKDQVEGFKCPFPPKSEQEQFVKIMTQADKSKFDGFKSQFLEWFGNPFLSPKNGESVSITDVADIVLGTTPNSKIKEYWDGELKWITPAEIEEESFIISDTVRHITEDGRNSANLTLLPVGSVLFSTRAPIGKVAIAGEEMYCNQGFKNFICKPELNNVFLYYTLRLNKEYLVSLGTGTTFKELSKKIVESIKISVPAKEQQEQFERVFRQSDKSKYYEINETIYGIL